MLKLADDPTKTKVQLKVGHPAGIYEVGGDKIHGWYIDASGDKHSAEWALDGRWGCFNGGMTLVNAPEPPVTVERWAVLHHGEIGMWNHNPSPVSIAAYQIKGIRKYTIEVTPGEGLEGA